MQASEVRLAVCLWTATGHQVMPAYYLGQAWRVTDDAV